MAESSAKEKKEAGQVGAGDAPTQSGKGGTEPTLALPAGTKPGAPEGVSAPAGTFLGPYELIEKVGQGGMGSVWKARHTKLDKLVAVKLLPPHLMTDAEAVSRFEREMKAVGKLEHAHIVRAMDAGQADGMHYLVMEYIEGTDLSKLVKNRGPRSVSDACQMVRHAALGLAHAHEHGLVHRDIKPSNLLLSKKGLVKILDLGLARLQTERVAGEASLTAQGEMMGTPDYMAPEQWQSAHTVGPAADLYALGCTLFHLLIGHAPFGDSEHSTHAQKLTAHLLAPPTSLRKLRPEVPEEVDTLCQKLLAKEPSERPSSANEVAQHLNALLKSWTKGPAETISWQVPPASNWRSTVAAAADWGFGLIRGRTGRLAIGGVVLAALFLGIVFTWSKSRPTPDPNQGENSAEVTASESVVVPTPVPAVLPAPDPAVIPAPVAASAPALAIAPFNANRALARQESWASHLGVPLDYTNSMGMRFRLVPPGEYDRGTPEQEIDELVKIKGKQKQARGAGVQAVMRSESPRHRVRIAKAFYLSAYEVTQGQFRQVMGLNPSYFSSTGGGRDNVAKLNPDLLPVESVTFAQAEDFCLRLSKTEARKSSASDAHSIKGYRLPTDAEWEYACRAGTITSYYCGGENSQLDQFAWFGKETTVSVGTLKPNAFGLFDMHGNVGEICQDFFAEDDYASLGSGVIQSPTGPITGTEHVQRGGGFSNIAQFIRSATRTRFSSPRSNAGFRPVLEVEFVKGKGK